MSAPSQRATLDAVLERITYANEETGYTVARVDTGRGGGPAHRGRRAARRPARGDRCGWRAAGARIRSTAGSSRSRTTPPCCRPPSRASAAISAPGWSRASARSSPTGSSSTSAWTPCEIIEEEPKRLIEVPGLGPKRTKMIAAAWEEQKAIKEVMVFLQGVGVSTSLAVRIYKKYGDASIAVVQDEPYRLAADVWGIGFKTADTIAQAVGIPHDSPQRVKAGLQYALSRGHRRRPLLPARSRT